MKMIMQLRLLHLQWHVFCIKLKFTRILFKKKYDLSRFFFFLNNHDNKGIMHAFSSFRYVNIAQGDTVPLTKN